MHYYKHHIGDFIKDTSNLTHEQVSVYLQMIWRYYLDEKPLEDDCESIAFAVRSDEKTVRQLLKHYFTLEADGWHHKRCDQVISEYHGKSQKARESANARWGNANALPTQTDRSAEAPENDANHKPLTNNQVIPPKPPKGGKSKPSGLLKPYDVSDEVWTDYIAHRKAKRSTISETVLDGMRTEAAKANITLEDALRICCIRGWQGFDASWIGATNGGRGNPAFGNGVAL